jgi:hypothetical protein
MTAKSIHPKTVSARKSGKFDLLGNFAGGVFSGEYRQLTKLRFQRKYLFVLAVLFPVD